MTGLNASLCIQRPIEYALHVLQARIRGRGRGRVGVRVRVEVRVGVGVRVRVEVRVRIEVRVRLRLRLRLAALHVPQAKGRFSALWELHMPRADCQAGGASGSTAALTLT